MTPPRDILPTLRELPPAAWVLFAGTFVNRFGSFVQVFLVLYLTDKGYSGLQAGLTLGSYGLGHMADRLGRRTDS